MSRREELRAKYSAKVEELDALVKELGEKYHKLCEEGKEDTPEGKAVYEATCEAMGQVNHYLRIMGRGGDGYDI